ncbi:MAG: glucose-6-phosphate 1-epimerase, partial [Pseudomonadota bacterium]|nr:glucose-6-phosphate 1-epimerase [Pseudomonadota bacterium]
MSDDTALPRASQPTGACLFDGQPAVHLRSPAGAQATVLLHGAHVVSWIPALGEEQLYLSPTSALGGTAAVRGGVPVIFPQFNQQGPLPKHGFVRNRAWTLQEATVRGEHAFAVLRLDADEATRAIWPHGFALEMTVSVDSRRLEMELAVINTGDSTIDFQAALHTYLRCGDVGRAQLEGLQG